eukprot:5570632-Amphidinium_carterae.2
MDTGTMVDASKAPRNLWLLVHRGHMTKINGPTVAPERFLDTLPIDPPIVTPGLGWEFFYDSTQHEPQTAPGNPAIGCRCCKAIKHQIPARPRLVGQSWTPLFAACWDGAVRMAGRGPPAKLAGHPELLDLEAEDEIGSSDDDAPYGGTWPTRAKEVEERREAALREAGSRATTFDELCEDVLTELRGLLLPTCQRSVVSDEGSRQNLTLGAHTIYGRGVVASTKQDKYQRLLHLLHALATYRTPFEPYAAFNVAKHEGLRLHRDQHNRGPSWVIALGAHVGGQLWQYHEQGRATYPEGQGLPGRRQRIKYRWHRFWSQLPHAV